MKNIFPTKIVNPILASGLWLVSSLLAIPQSSAATIVSYKAGTGATTPSPTSQGWTEGGTPSVAPTGGQETINGKTYNYWSISNPAPAANGSSAIYRSNLVANNFTNPAGWTATMTLRVQEAAYSLNGAWMQVSDGVSSWEIAIINNAADGHSINYRNSSAGITQISNIDVGADYFTLQLYFDPTASKVTFYLNGVAVGNPIARSAVGTAAANQLYLRFGDNDVSGRTYRTISHWNAVQLETGYAIVVPEGNTALLLMAGGGLLVFWSRSRIAKNRPLPVAPPVR